MTRSTDPQAGSASPRSRRTAPPGDEHRERGCDRTERAREVTVSASAASAVAAASARAVDAESALALVGRFTRLTVVGEAAMRDVAIAGRDGTADAVGARRLVRSAAALAHAVATLIAANAVGAEA